MGDKLLQFYSDVKNRGGIEAQIKLALITRISSIKAAQLPDTEENIELFSKAMKTIFPAGS